MRQSFRSSLWEEDKQVIAINLGSDHCAEHEWGIKKLQSQFGIDSENLLGLESRVVNYLPEENNYFSNNLYFKKQGNKAVLRFSQDTVEGLAKAAKDVLYTKSIKEGEFQCAWDEKSFLIYANCKKVSNFLKDLYKAILNKDAYCYIGRGGPFSSGGLILGIYSRTPQDFKDKTKSEDLERIKLEQAVKETHIKSLLKESNKSYFALTPRWIREDKKR